MDEGGVHELIHSSVVEGKKTNDLGNDGGGQSEAVSACRLGFDRGMQVWQY